MLPQDSALPEPGRNVRSDSAHAQRPRQMGYRTGPIEPAGPPWRAGGQTPPPGLANGPDAFTLLKALKRRWAVALLLGLIVAGGIGVGAWFLLTPKYTVFSQLKVSSQTNNPLDLQRWDRNEFPAYIRAQAERLRSRYVINAALKQEDVKRLDMINRLPQPIPWLEQELKIDSKEGSEFITVSMRGEDETALVTFINALVQAYYQEYFKAEREGQSKLVASLDKSLADAQTALRNNLDRYKQNAEQVGGPTGDPHAMVVKFQMLMTDLSDRKRRLEDVRAQMLQRQAFLDTFLKREQTPVQVTITEADLARELEKDPRYKEKVERFSQAEQRLKDFIGLPSSALYAQREVQMHNAWEAVEKLKADLKPKLVELMGGQEKTFIQVEIQRLRVELEVLARQEAPLLAEVKALQHEAGSTRVEAERGQKFSSELEFLKEEIKNKNTHVAQLTTQLDRAKYNVTAEPRVSINQEAAVQYKDNKRQILAALAAGLAGLLGVAFCVAWWEFRARRIQTSEEVVSGLGMRVMGSVPVLPRFAVLSNAENLDVHAQTLQESIDSIRTMLLRDSHVEGTRVVMVTSAVDGEGKTILASHLAQSLARAGRRTLLVDCDLRRPAAHQLFEQTLQPGFCEVLLNEVDETEAIRPTTATEGLFLFPAGQYDREVIQALAKDGMEKIFERMRDEYDFVVVDSHPILAATDSLLIGQYVDAVILSVLRDVSQVPRVYAAYQKLANLGIRVLGSVVTGVPEEEVYAGGYPYAVAQPAR